MSTNTDSNEKCHILIVGRSGNGKSSIANSIVGPVENPFPVKKTSDCEPTFNIYYQDTNSLRVLDCSGVVDEGMKVGSARAFVKGIVSSSSDTDVILYVMKYGVRFTKQEKDAVERMRHIFGQSVFSDLVVIAFSYGDIIFEHGSANGVELFEQWCRQQTSYAADLLAEVKYRCVLFDNRTRDITKQTAQREQLLRYFLRAENKSQIGASNEKSIVPSADENDDDNKIQSNEQFITKKLTLSYFEELHKVVEQQIIKR